MMKMEYDVIVVGGGHAGCEASAAAATMGSRVLLISLDMAQFGHMSCNPSMGGVAKGQIVREIDALGGLSGIVTDESMIQFRMLNRSKGPAMWSPRAQNDRQKFTACWRNHLEKINNLEFLQDEVVDLLVQNGCVVGIKTRMNLEIGAKTVVLTSGTFLNGVIHIGEIKFDGGRMGDFSAKGLTANLNRLGFVSDRMKTGTPVRVDGRSIDFNKLIEQKGDEGGGRFSFIGEKRELVQRSCWLAYTNQKVHEILRKGFSKSPMFQGRIEGVGPRYCPSIEDKIERFSHRERHQLFVEPEGLDTVEYYINGFSSSLPDYIQYEALRSVEGFENVKVFRPGYAIEYDYFPPAQLKLNLETRLIEGLFFAGQINGTTGYEEAAGQGLMAGINAHLKVQQRPPFILKRSEAYIGVLIDDLITKGVDEPYRMFTSRAEYRILLRQDNADLRLTPRGFEVGLATRERFFLVQQRAEKIEQLLRFLSENAVNPDQAKALLEDCNTPAIVQKIKMDQLLLRPQIGIKEMIKYFPNLFTFVTENQGFDAEILEEVEILVKYKSYIEKEKEIADKLGRLEDIVLHEDFDYQKIQSLSLEAREKLSRLRPGTIGQASRIAGVSPSDVSVLLVHLGR
jgi:tRNA uridine 5-carboxymethylaminomethyl modification enzyme